MAYNEELVMLRNLAQSKGMSKVNVDDDFEDDGSNFEIPVEPSNEDDVGYLVAPQTTRNCIDHGKNVSYTKNHRDRVGAVCKVDGCLGEFGLLGMVIKKTFAVKTHLGEHTYDRN